MSALREARKPAKGVIVGMLLVLPLWRAIVKGFGLIAGAL